MVVKIPIKVFPAFSWCGRPGAGDVAARALPALLKQGKVFALVRREEERARWRALGAIPLLGDLDQPATLRRLAGLADKVVHCAPPQNHGVHDLRTRHLIAALSRTGRPPRRLVYISTTGVYGDYAGALVSETSPLRTGSDRARRRVERDHRARSFRLWGPQRLRGRGGARAWRFAPGLRACAAQAVWRLGRLGRRAPGAWPQAREIGRAHV